MAEAENSTREHLRSSAVIFAPHQDDETLGCGGTIIRKRQTGTPVACVFMTNGNTSHQNFVKPEELTALRNREALDATTVLGVCSENVHFLAFPDSRLGEYYSEAVTRVGDILLQYAPAEVFVPYHLDGTPDHEATYRIVVEAVKIAAAGARICEYPVWFWNQWPWVSVKLRPNREVFRSLLRSWEFGFGRKAFEEFRSSVHIADVLPIKRKALEQHRTQMSIVLPGTGWPTLNDVSNGEFLQCFFQDFELFHVTPGATSAE